jgi:AraC-like DNA-binding protein
MKIRTPYHDPSLFLQSMMSRYNCGQSKYWNAQVLHFPNIYAEGSMQVFVRESMHYMRCKWKTFAPSLFSSTDAVKLTPNIDFRISRSGNVESSYLEGCKSYEWDISNVDGLRLFIPKDFIPAKKDLLGKLNKYCMDKNVSRLLKDLFEVYPENNTSFMLLEAKFLEFTHVWLKFLNGGNIEQSFEGLSDYHLKRLEEAKILLQQSIDNPLGIKLLSKAVSINECDLKKGFKKLNGLSIRQYVIKLRMEKAKYLILKTDHPIQHICFQLGYSNRGHFAQIYSKYFGISPLQHRLALRPDTIESEIYSSMYL